MKVLNLLVSGNPGGIESLCNNIDKYSKIDNYWVFLFEVGKFGEEIKQRNPEKIYFLGYQKNKFIKYIRTIYGICKRLKIDIITIHHEGIYCNMIYTILKKMNPNVKFVRYLHSCYEDKYMLQNKFIKDKINLYYLNKALQISDLIVCVSNAVKNTYQQKFDIKDKKKVVIYNGIGNEFFDKKIPNRNKKINSETSIIYVGRLVKVKGVDILISAVEGLLKDGYKVNLTVVGDGNERNYLENLVKELKIQNHVFFTGVQLNVIEWLDKSDIFVYPSIWKEAFGISVVEAMARGCIPIVSNIGGLPEVVEDNPKYMFDNKEMLKFKIKEIIENNEIGNKEIITYARKYKVEYTIKRLQNAYDEMLTK